MIEFVFVAPLFLMLMVGAIDWGWYFVLRQTVVNATREGARTASVQETDTAIQAAGVAATRDYLSRIGVSAVKVVDPVVDAHATIPGTSDVAVSVRLVGYESKSISGLTLTQVPATITVETVMRREVQP
jgi:Flp pilus assembly protein TadG